VKERIIGIFDEGMARGRASWRAIRTWYAAWVRLREARYAYLASILDTVTEAEDPPPHALPCRASAPGRRRRGAG
jgi:hypothetical protein